MKDTLKKVYFETTGARMGMNAGFIVGLFVLGGVAYTAGKKVLADAAILGIGCVLVGQVVDGLIVQHHGNLN